MRTSAISIGGLRDAARSAEPARPAYRASEAHPDATARLGVRLMSLVLIVAILGLAAACVAYHAYRASR